ncbi:MAG: class I SAM-dependent methyltransferase family protein [Candidatus Nanoarchaeia archaeon]|nr:class I SAM-dependent methyltransferase family protein [Candidatus Nanoarchaeia archaeon]
MKAVKVLKKDAEKTMQMLKSKGLFDSSHALKIEKEHLIIPVISVKGLKGLEIVDVSLKKRELQPRNLYEALKNKLTAKQLEILPRAFDTLGDIAIVEIPAELVKKEAMIGKALLSLNRHIKVVAKKAGIHSGVFRTQKLKIIAGAKRKETICKENNVLIKLNAETCYFSPRLSTERLRVARQVKQGESVLVMFSGVGPYNCVIAKNTPAKEVYGIEINPSAHKYALENVKINKLNNVKVFCGDVRKIVPKLGLKFDRILMPLPKSASDFLDIAKEAAKPSAVIHIYEILNQDVFPAETFDKVKKYFPKAILLNSVQCGTYGPGIIRGCVDFRVN